jgi:hypothetical protein
LRTCLYYADAPICLKCSDDQDRRIQQADAEVVRSSSPKRSSATQGDLEEEPPSWENASRSVEQLKLLIPEFPEFQPNAVDWRITVLRADLIHLIFGMNKRDQAVAALSAFSALQNVRELGRDD